MKKSLTSLIFLFTALLSSCAGPKFFVPDDGIRKVVIPPEYVVKDETGREKIIVFPREKNSCHCLSLLQGKNIVRQNFQCRYNKVLAVSEKNGTLMMVPRSGFSLFSNSHYGVFELYHKDMMMSRFTKMNSDIPDDDVAAVSSSMDNLSVWFATDDGASRFDPEQHRSYNYTDWDTFDEEGGGLSGRFLIFTFTPAVKDVVETGRFVYFITANKIFMYEKQNRKWKSFYPWRGRTLLSRRETAEVSYQTVEIEVKDNNNGKSRMRKKGESGSGEKKKKKKKKVKVKVVTKYVYSDYNAVPGAKGPAGYGFGTAAAAGDLLIVSHGSGFSIYNPDNNQWSNHIKTHHSWTRNDSCRNYSSKYKMCVEKVVNLDKLIFNGDSRFSDVSPSSIVEKDGRIYLGYSEHSSFGKSGMQVFDMTSGAVSSQFAGRRVYDVEFSGDSVFVAVEDGIYRGAVSGGNFKKIYSGAAVDIVFQGKRLWIMLADGLTHIDL